jgi:hypothetical protein
MKAFGLVLVLALAAFGCDDGGGGSGGSGGSGPTGACIGTDDQDFACNEDIQGMLTQCGLCSGLGTGCPNDCAGNPVAPSTSVDACANATMGSSCDPSLTDDCLGCYKDVTQCGTMNCATPCFAGPASCACLDCVAAACDEAFEACAGYSQGTADSGTSEDPAGDGVAGGPPSCEGLTYCEGGREGAGGVCDNSVVEPPEECDPPGSPNDSNEFCDAECKFFDPCAAPLDPPASCPAPSNPQCESATCSEDSGVITCGIMDASAGTPCDFAATNDGTCDGSGACITCATDEDCPDTDCSTGTCDMALGCQYANEATGTACGTDGQCSSASPSECQMGDCTDQGVASNSEFICGPSGGTIKSLLTQCGVCEALGFGCPNDCSGDPTPAFGPATECVANTLLLGGDGGACTTGLDAACVGCYNEASSCGSGLCTADCSNLTAGAIDGPNGCQCIDCVYATCDAAFITCAGFSQGLPAGTPNPHPGIIGGPPVCEAIPTPDCDN